MVSEANSAARSEVATKVFWNWNSMSPAILAIPCSRGRRMHNLPILDKDEKSKRGGHLLSFCCYGSFWHSQLGKKKFPTVGSYETIQAMSHTYI